MYLYGIINFNYSGPSHTPLFSDKYENDWISWITKARTFTQSALLKCSNRTYTCTQSIDSQGTDKKGDWLTEGLLYDN